MIREFTREEALKKKRNALQRIGLMIYAAFYFVEISMYFVLKASNLIYQDTEVYILRYMVKPMAINTAIVVISYLIIYKCSKINMKNFMQVLMINLMIACMAYVHHVFAVILIAFCVPIFLTVILQDKRYLNIITILSEAFTALIAIDCYVNAYGAGDETYFIPTIVIIMMVLFVCRFIAAMCIDALNEKEADLIEAKKAAEVSNESKSTFLANMSHEIRTPLNAVLSFNTMIIRESKENAIKDYAIAIKNSCQTLLSLINDILDLSKIESGKMEIVETEYDFASMIYDIMNMMSVRADSKSLDLQLEIDDKLPARLYGDDTRIRQILVNIMNNAIKYTETGSVTLSVSGEIGQEYVLLHFSVKDTGIGIKEEDMERLFAKFERIDEKKNKYVEGTGLGMSITTTFLDLMGSELKVNSVYGEGSEFYFDLKQGIVNIEPIGRLEERIKNREKDEELEVTFVAPDANILVVDDNAMNRNAFVGLLKDTRIKIEEAASGIECINRCQKKKYDIVFLDHMMPDMDGIETLDKLRKIENCINADTPIIALTANAIVGVKDEYLKAGFNDYITKPIRPKKLESMIVQYLPKELVLEKDAVIEINEEQNEDLPSVNGVSWNVALEYLFDKELLLETLNDFVTEGKDNGEKLKKLLLDLKASGDDNREEAFKNYCIQAHAMKSNAKMIGAIAISEMAKWLEFLAKDEKIDEIIAMNDLFLEKWNELIEELSIKFNISY